MTESSAYHTRSARYAVGEALARATPHAEHAAWQPRPDRAPLAILAESDAERLPDLVPRRYKRMAESPFTFLRGAAAVMARDLVGAAMAGVPVQACGDCHVGNFGLFVSPEGRVLFDINDFDETLPGIDFTVDLKRLATSIVVETRADAHADADTARAAAQAALRAYREHIHHLAALEPLACWRSNIDLDHEVAHIDDDGSRDEAERGLDAGLHQETVKADIPELDPATQDGPPATWRIADKGKKVFHVAPNGDREPVEDARAALIAYPAGLAPERRGLVERYALRDVAFKVVGIGSVGRVCAVGLYTDADGAPLFLQVKEARQSVLTPLVLASARAAATEGLRVVEGQRVMQAASDIFLGAAQSPTSGRSYYVRQLKNKKLSDVADLMSRTEPRRYAALCGRTLARAHARSGEASTIAGYMGESDGLDEAIARFAMTYADETTADHAALLAARG
ncbi:DUF2252 domain-containing protein [Methylobacterium sp. Leaf466]|uniref:DUF2252 domain-containing protein n=1 Tax=Methylobacterium sp. Leaf466 TaxID=1736386 RepID=UPI0006F66F36|nr:DUF2252 domain-containing protein [Methylobacterium sp. Leaf466]KQT84243.1 hypothetical protein ASG59_02270 [Methylobacterium sp. Leaf466]